MRAPARDIINFGRAGHERSGSHVWQRSCSDGCSFDGVNNRKAVA